MSRTTTQSQPELFPHDAADSTEEAAVADGYILDFITGEKNLRGCPETFRHCRVYIMQHPCGNERQDDYRVQVGST